MCGHGRGAGCRWDTDPREPEELIPRRFLSARPALDPSRLELHPWWFRVRRSHVYPQWRPIWTRVRRYALLNAPAGSWLNKRAQHNFNRERFRLGLVWLAVWGAFFGETWRRNQPYEVSG